VTAPRRSRWGPIVTAFSIWFVHFMACWAASEIWPHQWPANALAWGVTAIALLAMTVHAVRVNARHATGELSRWNHRFAQGAIAIATAAVLFSALPSIVFLP
jgi:succinate dehydrogenase hydrophobic anchor subunit